MKNDLFKCCVYEQFADQEKSQSDGEKNDLLPTKKVVVFKIPMNHIVTFVFVRIKQSSYYTLLLDEA